MKYFHSLTITGFLLPFLSLSAENALDEAADTNAIELREEVSLTSLDEELSLLDEEFEEFKEELYSLENELQKQEKAPVLEESQEEIASFEEEAKEEPIALEVVEQPSMEAQLPVALRQEDTTQEDAIVFESIAPEIDEPASVELMSNKNTEAAKVMTTDHRPTVELSKKSTAKPQTALPEEKLVEETPAVLNVQGASLIGEPMPMDDEAIAVDLKQAFSGSPIIYSLLFAMSVVSVGIWLYSILSLRSSARIPSVFVKNLQSKLTSNNFEEALSLCEDRDTLFCKMIASGILSRRHGLPVMIESMKAEGKRISISFWQKIGLLNDIAIIAPMLGLLGTVLGMFYAFYNVNRSIESISTLFDGLGISVGTTVAGLIVAILALILHSTAKYRLVRSLAYVENEAQSIAALIDDRTSIYKG